MMMMMMMMIILIIIIIIIIIPYLQILQRVIFFFGQTGNRSQFTEPERY
jgi:hypothetical protein